MKTFLHILKYKLLLFARFNDKLNTENILKNAGSGIIYAGFTIGAFFFIQKMVAFLLNDLKVGLFLLHEFMSMILFIFFIAVNIGNVIVSYSTLYKSPEVAFMLTKPVSPAKIFLVKFLDNFFYSSSTLLLILTAVISGYAVYFKLSFLSIITLILFNFLPFMMNAGLLGVIFLLIIIKSASYFGVKKVLYGIPGFYVLSVILFFKINSPVNLVKNVMKYYPFVDKDEFLNTLIPPVIKFMPNNWLSESAYWTVKNNIAASIQPQFLQILVMIVLFLVAAYLGKTWFLDTWLLNQKLSTEFSNRIRNNKSGIKIKNNAFINPRIESIIRKDTLVFFREPNQVIHLIVLLFLIAVFLGSVSGIKFMRLGNYYLHTLTYLSIILFNLLFISTLGLRFVFPIISLEGLSFWKIKSSPVSQSGYFKAKTTFHLTILIIIGQALNYFATKNYSPELMLIGAVLSFFATVTIFSINYGLGGLYSNFKEKNAIRLASSQGATLSFLLTIIYMIFLVLILFLPLSEYFLSEMIKKNFELSKIYRLFVPFILLSAVVTSVFLKIGYDALKKDF